MPSVGRAALSVLDLAPVAEGSTPGQALRQSIDLAQHVERLGYVRHSHGRDGREEYHVLPEAEHAHLVCEQCGGTWEVAPAELRGFVATLAKNRSFKVNLSHLTVSGRCADCSS